MTRPGRTHPPRAVLLPAALSMALQSCAVLADAPPTPPVPHKEKPMIQMSRSVPPQVPAIVHQGVRYEQVMNGIRQGLPHRNGYLSATDVSSGQRLWVAQIYEVQYDPALEKDVQDVYFKQMTLTPDQQQLSIENEAGKRFLLKLSDHTVTSAP